MSHPAFTPPTSITRPALRQSLFLRCTTTRRHASARTLIRPAPIIALAGWQDIIFPSPQPSDASQAFETMRTNFPSDWAETYLLGTSKNGKHLYCIISTSNKTKGTRPSYAISSFAIPLPLTSAMDKNLVHDAFSAFAADIVSRDSLVAYDTSFISKLLPPQLLRICNADAAKAAEIGASIIRDSPTNSRLNAATVFLDALDRLQLRLVGACVEEVETCAENTYNIAGHLFLQRQTAQLYGEVVYGSDVLRVQCTPAVAVAVANAANVACYMRRQMFDSCSLAVVDMASAFSACGQNAIEVQKEAQGAGGCTACVEEDVRRCAPWEMKAEDVLQLSDEALRRELRKCDVGVTTVESRESLLRKFVQLMDEVERREVGIMLAADAELFGLAGELQRNRSKRGVLLQELREAEKAEMWVEAARIGERIRVIESQTADITAEPGSYSSYLDQDEWYRPNR